MFAIQAVDTSNWKKSQKVAELEKLARKCKILPIGRRYTLFYQDCTTEQQHIDRLRQLFEQSGFEGYW